MILEIFCLRFRILLILILFSRIFEKCISYNFRIFHFFYVSADWAEGNHFSQNMLLEVILQVI